MQGALSVSVTTEQVQEVCDSRVGLMVTRVDFGAELASLLFEHASHFLWNGYPSCYRSITRGIRSCRAGLRITRVWIKLLVRLHCVNEAWFVSEELSFW